MFQTQALELLAAKLRMIEDCLQRAKDGMEGIPEMDEFEYIRKQVGLSAEYSHEASGIMFGYGERWDKWIELGKGRR